MGPIDLYVMSNISAIKTLVTVPCSMSVCWVSCWDPEWVKKLKEEKNPIIEKAFELKEEFPFSLMLFFDDVEDKKIISSSEKFKVVPFNREMAEETVSFLKRALNCKISLFIFSCMAGISRSSAIAEAWAEFLKKENIDFTALYERSPLPNVYVKKLMLLTLGLMQRKSCLQKK